MTFQDRLFRISGPYEVQLTDSASPTILPDEAYASTILLIAGTLTAPRTLQVPHETGPAFSGWMIENRTAQTVTCVGATGTGTDVPAGGCRLVFSDGLDVKQQDVGGSGGGGDVALSSSTPSAVGSAGAPGVGTAASRADHVHAHGTQAGGALHAVVTTSVAGFMSPTDKVKLDGIPDGGGSGSIPTTRQIIAGAGLTGGGDLSADRTVNVGAAADGSISVTADAVGVGVLATDAQHGARGGGTQHAVATTGAAGFLSAADKAKLDGIPSGGGAIPQPTAANQLYNSSAASTAAWTDDPVVDTIKANTAAEVGTYAATAAAGNGANSALVAQGGGVGNGNGGFMAVCGGIPNGTGSGGGAGLASRGDASGLSAGTICVSAEEVGGRKCAALMCASQLTSTVFPVGAGDGVIVIGRCITYPTTGPATSYGLAWVGNGLGNNGVPIQSSADGLAYSNAIRKTVAAGVTATFSLGNLAGTAQYGPSPNNYRMGAAMGMIHVAALGNSSGWTATGASQYYWKSGYFVSHYNGSGPSGPWLAYLDNTTIPAGSLIALAVDGTTFEVTLTVKNTNATSIDIHVYFDWKQSW